VPAAEKERRRARIMEIQAAISLARNRAYVGQTLEVLLEGPAKSGRGFIGRTRFQAPEVDGQVRIGPSAQASCGPQPIVRAKIIGAGSYDLQARIVP
jgi:ribosomal protein S12 methylthiotransferase